VNRALISLSTDDNDDDDIGPTWWHVVVIIVDGCRWIIPTSTARWLRRVVVIIRRRVERITVENVMAVARIPTVARIPWRLLGNQTTTS